MTTILLVDDDKFFRASVVATLKGLRYEVFEAVRGSEADAQLAKRTFDLIIVDGLLPDTDGIGWMERLRASGDRTPLLFMSAFWSRDPRLAELDLAGVIRKPAPPKAVLLRVQQTLRKSGATAELPPEAIEGLADLQAEFAAELPRRIAGVFEAVAQLRESPVSAPIRGVAIRRVHQIAGTAGTFGFGLIGDACAALEQILRRFAQHAPTRLAWLEIDRALDQLAPQTAPQRLSA
jgi:CheY-like chemotaxis protein